MRFFPKLLTKSGRIDSQIELERKKATLQKAKADRLRYKNQANTSKFNANQRKIVQKIEEIDNMGELSQVLAEYGFKEKEDPLMVLVNKFVSGDFDSEKKLHPSNNSPSREPDTITVTKRERLINEYMTENPKEAAIIDRRFREFAKKKGYGDVTLR